MTPSDHLEAAKVAADVLSQSPSKQARAAVVHHWAVHILAFLKGPSNG